MTKPPLVRYSSVKEYREHFYRIYCRSPILTFDGIPVRFRKEQFDHCFYESRRRDGTKDWFSRIRAERVDWIKATLQDPNSRLYQGWDRRKKKHNPARRVSHSFDDYVVVIQLRRKRSGQVLAYFSTAFCADDSIQKIVQSPRWTWKAAGLQRKRR